MLLVVGDQISKIIPHKETFVEICLGVDPRRVGNVLVDGFYDLTKERHGEFG
jgi:hypothetical protein